MVETGEGEGERDGQELWVDRSSELWLAVREGGWMKTEGGRR